MIPREMSRREKIEADLRAGLSTHEITERHGVSGDYVRDLKSRMKNRGQPTLQQRRHGVKIHAE